ncbi:MAG: hypothetical protein LBQ54_00330 [Planctomycetaceae bacterium]|nr:hypothetical protein [Planctomycetaceae bacterium]
MNFSGNSEVFVLHAAPLASLEKVMDSFQTEIHETEMSISQSAKPYSSEKKGKIVTLILSGTILGVLFFACFAFFDRKATPRSVELRNVAQSTPHSEELSHPANPASMTTQHHDLAPFAQTSTASIPAAEVPSGASFTALSFPFEAVLPPAGDTLPAASLPVNMPVSSGSAIPVHSIPSQGFPTGFEAAAVSNTAIPVVPANNTAMMNNEQKLSQFEADQYLLEAVSTLETNPVRSMIYALKSVQKFEELGLKTPFQACWALSQSIISQNLGMALNGFTGGVQAMTVSEDGQWLLLCATNGQLWIWDLHDYDKASGGFPLAVVPEGMSKLQFTSDLKWAVGVSKKGTVWFWDMSLMQPGERPVVYSDPSAIFTDFVLSKNVRWMAAVAQNPNQGNLPPGQNPPSEGIIHLFDLAALTQSGQITNPARLFAHSQPISSMTMSDDSHWLVSGSFDKTISLYDLTAVIPGIEHKTFHGSASGITDVAVSPDGKMLAAAEQEGIVRVWNLESPDKREQGVLDRNVSLVSKLKFSENNKWFAAGYGDSSMKIWKRNPASGLELAQILTGHRAPVRSIQFSPQNDNLISWSDDQEVRIWDLSREVPSEQVLVFKSDSRSPFSSVLLTADEKWLLLGQPLGTPSQDSRSGLRLWPMKFEEILPCAALYSQHLMQNTPTILDDSNIVRQAMSADHASRRQ